MSLIILNVDEVRRTLSASGGAFVVHDKEVDIVRFAINSGFADIVLDGQVALRVMYQRPGESQVRAKTLTYHDTDGLRNYYDWQLLSADLTEKGTLTVALCILRTDEDVEEWHTTPCQVRVLDSIHTDDSDEGDETITPTVAQRVAVLESMIQRVASGAPIVVGSASEMTDTEQIYVLTTDGYWYYHNGSAWTQGGVYGAIDTDKTLTLEDMPADAGVTGTKIAAVEDRVDILNHEPDFEWVYNKLILPSGTMQDSDYYAITNIVRCSQGDVFNNLSPTRDEQSGFSFYHLLYSSVNSLNDTLHSRVGASSTRKMIIPDGVTGYRFMFGRSPGGGVPIADGDTDNVVLDIVRRGPSYSDTGRHIKILCIGNSFTEDCVSYAPYVMGWLSGDVQITLGLCYIGSGSIDNYVNVFDNDGTVERLSVKRPGVMAYSITSNPKFKSVLTAEKWDIVTFQQNSANQANWSTYANLNSLIDKVVGHINANSGKPVRLGWLMPQIRKLNETEASYPDAMACVQNVLNTTPIGFVIPCGTAIQNARQTSLNDLGIGGGLTADQKHLQEGLPCLLAAYVSAVYFLQLGGVYHRSVMGCPQYPPTKLWIDNRNIPGQNGADNLIVPTTEQLYLAQKCAVAALKKPFESLSGLGEDIGDIQTDIRLIEGNIGNLADLTTEAKTDLVSAINEVNEHGGGGGGSVTVDDALSATSTNPVQNKVITVALAVKADKATTLAGYGITDVYTKTESDGKYLTSHQDISGKQDKSNLVTSLSSSSTDTQYPSAKCVYDALGDIETLLAAL